MKKLLFVCIALVSMKITVGQVRPIPTKIPKDYSKALAKPQVVVNRTTGNYPEIKMNIDVTVENNPDKGYEVRFSSTVNIEKLEIVRSEPTQMANTMTFNADTKTGYFYMDSPAYKGSNTYILRFYLAGKTKYVWTTAIQRKAS